MHLRDNGQTRAFMEAQAGSRAIVVRAVSCIGLAENRASRSSGN